MLGAGKLGKVRLAHRQDRREKKYAVKSNPLAHIDRAHLRQFEKEAHLLRQLDHPNIVRLHEILKDNAHVHLVMDYCAGGELFAQINEAEKVEEKYAATIMQQLLYAIAYLHDRRICHRNVRPDNFLFAEKSKDSEIKLIDFGFSWSYSRRSLASITELQGITATADGLDVGDRKEN